MADTLPPPKQRAGRMQGWTIAERFNAYAEIPEDRSACWGWTGERQKAGYALVNEGVGGRRRAPASRISWSLYHGRPWPDGMIACHSCDNPICVNPQHIWPGTNKDNTLDAVKKGRVGAPIYKTICKRGHALTPDNVLWRKGRRGKYQECRICGRAKKRAAYAKKVGKA